MLCKKCNNKNLLKADYCRSCGNKFTKEEKDEAYNKTIYGKFENIEEKISYFKPIEKIKGSKLLRAGVLVVIIIYSLFIIINGGNNLRIEESDQYQVLLNKDTGVYWLVSESPNVNVDLHIPRKAEILTIHNVDDNQNILFSENYSLDSGISLTVNDDYHYIIQVDFENSSQNLEVYVVTN